MTTIEDLAAEVARVDEKINEVLNLNLSEFVSTYQLDQLHYIDQTELENRIAAIDIPQLPENLITQTELENRIASIDVPQLPGGLITESELEARLAQLNIPTIPSNLATTTYVENRVASIDIPQLPSGLITEGELEARIAQIDIPSIPSNLATTNYVDNRISQIPQSTVTQQDIELAAAAVDAKFDMLRSAIAESTNFATLKARLLAVLQ